jgi:hypothetical protein
VYFSIFFADSDERARACNYANRYFNAALSVKKKQKKSDIESRKYVRSLRGYTSK